jgi:orotidine-5'-phosphate decarboxylase
MHTVMERLHQEDHHPLVLAVTALTSFDEETFHSIYGAGIDDKTEEFAIMSAEAGLSGVVCSTFESRAIKEATHDTFLTLCPGIRPFGEDAGDQQRIATLDAARKELVDFPVIGRPIYRDPDPVDKVRKILEAMG